MAFLDRVRLVAAALYARGSDDADTAVRVGGAGADAMTAPADGALLDMALGYAFNGTTWDRWRNNQQGYLLVSSARTSDTASSEQINYNGRGVLVFLDVTAASGTGGLQTKVQAKDYLSGKWVSLNASPPAVTAAGTLLYMVYPSATAGANQNTQSVLPRTWRVYVIHGDGSSYTYSVSYCYVA